MTYNKLYLKLLIVIIIICIIYVLISFLFIDKFSYMERDILISSFLPVCLLSDAIFMNLWKGDLFSEQYKGTASYIFFKVRMYADIIINILLIIIFINEIINQ